MDFQLKDISTRNWYLIDSIIFTSINKKIKKNYSYDE